MAKDRLSISLLGPFEVTLNHEAMTDFRSDTARALLAYLAMEPGTLHRRDVLAGLFWPDHPNASALRNLRTTLSRLRDAIGDRKADPPFLDATRRTLELVQDDRITVDVWALRHALTATERHDHAALDACATCARHLQTVADLYRGDFLEGFTLDSAEFETWVVTEREELHWQVLEALSHLAAYHEKAGDYDAAIAAARRQVELEPWREVAHRRWMRALALSGRRNAALAQFAACRDILADELGVEPEAATRRLYEQIRAGAFASRAPADKASARSASADSASTPKPARATSPTALSELQQTARHTPENPPLPEVGRRTKHPPPPPPVSPERRVVTVLGAEITGVAALQETLDMEDWTTCLASLLQAITDEVHHFGGQVTHHDAGEIVALFGASEIHEDDPERAVLAAMAMEDVFESRLRRMAQEMPAWRAGLIDLDLRAVVHTGDVVVSADDHEQPLATAAVMGDAMTTAAHLVDRVPAGEIRVTPAAHRSVAPLFEWASTDEGKGGIALHTPLAPRFPENKGRGLPGMRSPLVGRDRELNILLETVGQLQSGVGAIVTLVGEAGIGKSRLVAEARAIGSVQEDVPQEHALRWIEGRCLSYDATTAYALWISILRALVGVTRDASATKRERALRDHLRHLAPEDAEAVYPYLALLIGAPVDAKTETTIDQMDPARRREATFYAVEAIVEAAARQPLVLVCEDLHWADATSLQLLQHLLPLADRVPLTFICVFRPRRDHGCWRIREIAMRTYPHRHLALDLEPLPVADGRQLLRNLLLSVPGPDGLETVDSVPKELKEAILSRGEGNPFYVEEILRSLIRSGAIVCDEVSCEWRPAVEAEGGTGPANAESPIPASGTPATEMPSALYGVLRTRIDSLTPGARNVLQLASVIGRIFPKRLLVEIAERSTIDDYLIVLQREQLIRQRARLPEPEYIFHHQLTLEAAYGGLLRRIRRTLHRRVAEALERLYPDRIEEQLGILAHHWERAGDTVRAIDYLQRAGRRAAAQYANDEALADLDRALSLVPESDRQRRYDLLVERVTIYDRIGSRDAQQADLMRLQEIAEALDDGTAVGKRRLAQVTLYETQLYEYTLDHEALAEAAQRAIRLARAAGDAALEAKARTAWGIALTQAGDLEGAHLQWQRALSLARKAGDRQAEAGVLRRLGLRVVVSKTTWDERKTYLEENVRIQQEIGNRAEEGAAWNALANITQKAHDPASALVYSSKGTRLCRMTGLRREEAWGHFQMAWAYCRLGQLAEADDHARQAITLFQQVNDSGGDSASTVIRAWVADAAGDEAASQKHAERAIELANAVDAYGPAVASRLALGDALTAMERWREARQAYREALDRSERTAPNGVVARAGLARVALAQHDPSEAATQIKVVLRAIEDDPVLYGAFGAMRVYLSCYRTLQALGDRRAEAVLRRAYRLVQERAAKIEDEALRRSYLENEPTHREIVALAGSAPKGS